jgi:ribosomal protein S18 acetylase RimI-like enzyme
MTHIVEKLDFSQRAEILEVLKQAFATHPMLPPDTPIEKIQALMELILDYYSGAERRYLFGIRRESQLVCVSFSADSKLEPKGFDLVRFIFRLLRILGWRLAIDCFRIFAQRPKYDTSYLDLNLLGTIPAFHGQGCGRSILRFLFDFAVTENYPGVILIADKDNPAFRLYCREGFTVDKETKLRKRTLTHLRRDNTS